MLVDNEIISEFIVGRSFLDPSDDRVLDEMLNRPIGGGLRLRDLPGITKDTLRTSLSKKQEDKSSVAFKPPVLPQRRRVAARKRLDERSKSVGARVLKDLDLSPAGRQIGKIIKSAAGLSNRSAIIKLMASRVNEHLRISRGRRHEPSADDLEDALAALDTLGDEVRDEIQSRLE